MLVAAQALDTTLDLDPNSAFGWNRRGWVSVFLGDAPGALAAFGQAMRLSPFDPMNFNTFIGIGFAHFIGERYDEAVDWVKRGVQSGPTRTGPTECSWRRAPPRGVQAKHTPPYAALLAAYPELTIAKTLAVLPLDGALRARYARPSGGRGFQTDSPR